MHSEPVEKVLVVPDMDKYITIGRDAAFRVWQPHNLSLTRTVQSGVRWLNDIVYLRRHKQLVVASMDRSLAWYEINRGAYECIGKCAPLTTCPYLPRDHAHAGWRPACFATFERRTLLLAIEVRVTGGTAVRVTECGLTAHVTHFTEGCGGACRLHTERG